MIILVGQIHVSLNFLEFPPTCTCDGGDESPQIQLQGLIASSVAVWVVNPYIRSCCSFTPWLIWNIPPMEIIPGNIPKIPLVTSPIRCIQGMNDHGITGYSGPCPPPGESYRYQFRVYGLDAMLEIPPGSTSRDLIAAMRGHVLQFGETIAMYTR
jgi:Raf kinase inhibitor-like YbhB/YbcL family protein